MARQRQIPTMQARYTFADHASVHCAKCGKLVSGPHQATGLSKGKGHWARECSKCGMVTRYDVESENLSGIRRKSGRKSKRKSGRKSARKSTRK